MHHNLSDDTRRRLALCLASAPHHANRRRRQPQDSPFLGWLLLAASLLGIAVLAATAP